jgi:hypothetical protein
MATSLQHEIEAAEDILVAANLTKYISGQFCGYPRNLCPLLILSGSLSRFLRGLLV